MRIQGTAGNYPANNKTDDGWAHNHHNAASAAAALGDTHPTGNGSLQRIPI